MNPQLAILNESALELTFPEPLSDSLLDRVRLATEQYQQCGELKQLGVTDVVPAWQRILFHFSGGEENAEDISDVIRRLPLPSGEGQEPAHHILPVRYDGEDLESVAAYAGLAVEEVVRAALSCGHDRVPSAFPISAWPR